jgi:hypothetical protein
MTADSRESMTKAIFYSNLLDKSFSAIKVEIGGILPGILRIVFRVVLNGMQRTIDPRSTKPCGSVVGSSSPHTLIPQSIFTRNPPDRHDSPPESNLTRFAATAHSNRVDATAAGDTHSP